jgi:ribonuclease J
MENKTTAKRSPRHRAGLSTLADKSASAGSPASSSRGTVKKPSYPSSGASPRRAGVGRRNRPIRLGRPKAGSAFRQGVEDKNAPKKVYSKSGDNVRIIPIGGVEEVGRNMTVVEYKDEIIVLDAGLQFPEEETPGVDYIIPNTQYLEERKDKIKGLVISHGHLDHNGAIPYLMDKLGNPTIYTTKMTKAMTLKRQSEFPHLPPLDIKEVTSKDKIKVGKELTIRFFDITHTIPDAIGTIVETPLGNVIYPGDFRIELDKKNKPKNIEPYVKLGKENNLALLLESTNAEIPGFAVTEDTVREALRETFDSIEGRIFVGTFSSQMERIVEIIKIAEQIGRKVFIDGYSMKANIEIAKELGILKPKAGTVLSVDQINDYPDNQVLSICTGAQGEKNAALMRIANQKHKSIKLHEEDTVVLSASIIPGNEKSIQNLKDNLARRGAEIVHYKNVDIHASGHAYAEELKIMISMLKPKFFIPIHGHYFMLKTNAKLAMETGIHKKNIIAPLNNGAIIDVNAKSISVLKESVPSNYVMVDGLGVGDVKEVVLRDRQMLAQDGIFVMIVVIDSQTGKVRSSPDIISRGFVYLRESQDLLKQSRFLIRKTVEEATEKMHPVNITYVKENLREKIAKYLFQQTQRRPMVLPVLLEV